MAKLLRRIAFALVLWLLIALAIGTAVRMRLERRTVYIGDARPLASHSLPLDVGHTRAVVRDARHHEQEIG